ncbi:MAG: hypothetical protein ACYCU8_03720 [Ferrimicrobium acidiphilum]
MDRPSGGRADVLVHELVARARQFWRVSCSAAMAVVAMIAKGARIDEYHRCFGNPMGRRG